jgi:transglutaminase-like putative cysteine protease
VLLTVSHVSRYRYDRQVPYALQRLRLWPVTGPGQIVRRWDVAIEGARIETSYLDGFGNRTALVRHDRGTEEIVIRAGGEVETENGDGVFGPGSGLPPVWLFERATDLTAPGPAIATLADEMRGIADRLALLHRLMDEIHRRVAYIPGSTSVATEAETALIAGNGVCQDHSHIFIAVARRLGIPARYVSGYLMLEGVTEQTASHAWGEAWVDGLGWIGFDAANDVCPDARYVRLAAGLDYHFAAPVSGIRMGNAAETLAVEISVEQ